MAPRALRRRPDALENPSLPRPEAAEKEEPVPKFLIEVPHSPERLACARVVQVFLSTGSHFLTQAEWGCYDGVHSAWMVVDVENKEEAMRIVPASMRAGTKITGLNRFSMSDVEPILKQHPGANAT
jgi:hypothetical protein